MSDEPSAAKIPDDLTAKEPRWRTLLVFALLLIGLYICSAELVRLGQWHVGEDSRPLLEARMWQQGRLDLPPTGPNPERGSDRPFDSAYYKGKVYNIYPPLFTAVCYVGMELVKWQQSFQALPETQASTLYPAWYVAILAVPLPFVGFWAFRAVTKSSVWAAVLTAYWLLATPMFPVLVNCRLGSINNIYHVWSNVGLLLIAGDMLGRRRIWPSALGLILGAMTRQLTFLFILGIIWIIWRHSSRKLRDFAIIGVASAIGIGTLATMNYLKFDNPFDDGYLRIYEGRSDYYATRAHMYGEHGRIFDPRFIPENAVYMNLNPPEVREARGQLLVSGNPRGTSIWITSPLLLLVFIDAKRWWRDHCRRALMLASVVVTLAFLSYHNTGSVQHGMFRFALDVIPIWLACIAPFAITTRSRWFLVACLGWGALYNHLLCATVHYQAPLT